MGNALISGILFQPPSPPNDLKYFGPNKNDGASSNNDNQGNAASGSASASTVSNNSTHPQVKYIWIYTSSGTFIPAVHITHPHPSKYGNSTLLYSHGNAEDLGLIANFLTDLSRLLGINILCYDYSGYGVSTDVVYASVFLREFGDELMRWKERKNASKIPNRDNHGLVGWVDAITDNDAANTNSKSGNHQQQVGWGREIFVAPMIHPINKMSSTSSKECIDGQDNTVTTEITTTVRDEFDFVDDGATDECLDDCYDHDDDATESSCLSWSNNGHVVDEEDEDAGDYFTNACGAEAHGCANYGDGPKQDLLETPGSAHQMQKPLPSPSSIANDNINGTDNAAVLTPKTHTATSKQKKLLSPKTRRRLLLTNHSWTAPTPSESQCYNDIQAAYQYLVEIEKVDPKNILLYGKSVGSGPTCWLAQKLCNESGSCEGSGQVKDQRDDITSNADGSNRSPPLQSQQDLKSQDVAPGGVVLHSPFLSVIRVVLDVGFTTIGDLFPNVDRIQDFTCPVYVIHGNNDEIVPFYHGESLFNSLPDSSKTVPFWARGAGHNNIEMEMPTAYIKRLQQFVRQCHRINNPPSIAAPRSITTAHDVLRSIQQQRQAQHLHMRSATRPCIKRYASQDTFLESRRVNNTQTSSRRSNMSPLCGEDLVDSMDNISNRGDSRVNTITPYTVQGGQITNSKQRKKKGTLVMKSSHNHHQSQQNNDNRMVGVQTYRRRARPQETAQNLGPTFNLNPNDNSKQHTAGSANPSRVLNNGSTPEGASSATEMMQEWHPCSHHHPSRDGHPQQQQKQPQQQQHQQYSARNYYHRSASCNSTPLNSSSQCHHHEKQYQQQQRNQFVQEREDAYGRNYGASGGSSHRYLRE